jgi:hypothetical protein
MPIRLLLRGDCNLRLSLSSSLSEVRRLSVIDVGVGSWNGGMLDGPGCAGGAVAWATAAAIGGRRRTSRSGAGPGPGGTEGIPGGPYGAV